MTSRRSEAPPAEASFVEASASEGSLADASLAVASPAKPERFDLISVSVTREGTARRAFALSIVTFCATIALGGSSFAELTALLGVGLLFGSVALLFARRPTPAALFVEGDNLVIERSLQRWRIALDRIALGLMVPGQRAARTSAERADVLDYEVQLELKNGDVICAKAGSMAEASAILESARLDASQRRLSLRLRRATSQLFVGLFVVPLALVGGTGALSFALLWLLPSVTKLYLAFASMGAVALGIGVLWRGFMSAEITIGSDGIVVRKRYRKRYISYARLLDIAERGGDIELRYRDGTSEVIPGDIDDPARRTALVSRMREAMGAGGSDSAHAFALGRGGRPIAAWREALLRRLDGDAGYRSSNLTRDDALVIVRDAGARIEHRVAAALALSASRDPAIQRRVRVAAEACALERVRVAIEQAATGELDEETLAAALREEAR